MKLSMKEVKNVKPNKSLYGKIIAIIISVLVVAGSFIIINKADQAARETISVIRIKSEGINAYEVLTDAKYEEYSIIKKEFNENMIKAEDVEEIEDKYVKYYLRGGSVLFNDQISNEKPLKNEWLYELDEKKEILTLPYDYLECGGDILTPGDRIRIRVSYEKDSLTSVTSNDDINPNMNSNTSSGKTIMVTEVLFDSITVRDMLNANSHSIYEVYKEIMSMDEEEKQSVMKSQSFLKNIQPRALVLEASSDQIDNFSKYKGKQGQTLLITILSRANSTVILDQLPTLENEVESWIEK